ncbi:MULTISPECIES: nucleotide exchange factor GrpE [Devosia]|uniref:nucleotide exchange factor GrpE n=1 Tax=Devosia TaxID=46913 RepID=UPI0027359E3B|nr:nucleotide exchange factor GrpE [Devosia sp.]MDP2782187.1 nucleotide exchange factor GrpE [Devosia sp.]
MSDENAASGEMPEVEIPVEETNEGIESIDPTAALRTENAELKDRVLRTVAEMENLRKRTEREINDTRSYAIAGFARDMLSATDALSRALITLPAETRETGDATTKSLIEGIELAEREMQRLLAKHGVKPIEAQGEKFDPHVHQAMFEVPDPSQPEGTVVQVVQPGFLIGDRVLRPAMVGVAKGGPSHAPASEAVDKSA